MPVVHLDDFDVVVGIEQARDLLGQAHQQGDAEAHIGRLNDRGPRRGRIERGLLGRAETGGADDQGRALG